MKNLLLIAAFVVALFGCSKSEEDGRIVVNPYVMYGYLQGDKVIPYNGVCSMTLYVNKSYIYLPFGSNFYPNPEKVGFYCNNTTWMGFYTRTIFSGGKADFREPNSTTRRVYETYNGNEIKHSLYKDGKLEWIELYKQK